MQPKIGVQPIGSCERLAHIVAALSAEEGLWTETDQPRGFEKSPVDISASRNDCIEPRTYTCHPKANLAYNGIGMTDSQVRDGPATTRLHVVCNLASMAMPVTLLAIASFSIQFESSLRGVILAVMAVVSLLYIAMMVRVVRQHGFIRINPIDLYLPVLSAIELFILVKHNGNHMFPSPLTLYATLIAFTLFLAFLIARRQSRVQPTAATMESS
ncbi:MAG: hypothetical protein GC165_00295 [Armatimonadetes bacterium]|nr:hypothetical protein [Armatimonadota bacterium]MBS1729131.1 hypothetical protein [Armatimonadota bacterium]